MVNTTGISNYGYDRSSLLDNISYPNGAVADYSYDDAWRVTQVINRLNGAVASQYDYTYDSNGNRLSQQETNGGAVETTGYTYDNNDRLTRADYPDATLDYGYDSAYNRTSETAVEKVTSTTVANKTFSYNNRNQVTSISDSANAANNTTYDYDANGNQTVKTQNGSTLNFLYDVRDRLVRVSQDTTTLGQFRYDYAGMRIQKEGSQGVVRYTYDDGSVLLQTDDAGATLAKYDYGPDRLLSLEQATEGEQFYHFDALGSVVNLSKPDGSLQARYQYDAWGNERVTTGSSWNRFAFTGHEKDEETGLYYFKARFYDPQLGRFLSQDAYLGEDNTPPSLHRYLYAYANPTVYIDLDGYEATTVRPGMGPAGLIPGMAQGHWQADYDENGKTVGQEALAPVIEFVEGAWSGAKNLAEIAAKKWIESNVLPYIVTEDSGPTILTTPIHENEPTVLTTPIHENEPTVLTTPIQETGPTTYTTPIQENGPTVYVTPDQSDLIDSGPMLNVRTGQDRDHVTYRGTKIDPVTGVAKPYTGYASAPSSEGLSAAEIVLRRYRGNFDDFGGVAPDVTYSGSDVGGKQTARGLEQHNYEQDVKKYGKENVSNKQNPVGQKNPNRDAYSEAAKRELNL